MGVLDDLKAAIDAYPVNNCTVNFVQPLLSPGEGTWLNTGETIAFKVVVVNQGEFDMKNVVVKVIGTNHLDVGPSLAGPYSGSAISAASNIDSGQAHNFGVFYGRGTIPTGETPLTVATAQIVAWDASFDHLLTDHSGSASLAGGSFVIKVLPN
jgi:hypothetical protein